MLGQYLNVKLLIQKTMTMAVFIGASDFYHLLRITILLAAPEKLLDENVQTLNGSL